MTAVLPRLRTKLGSDPAYFQTVYNHTFEFAKQAGQRSISACFLLFCGSFIRFQSHIFLWLVYVPSHTTPIPAFYLPTDG
jgi:hypothetical protein